MIYRCPNCDARFNPALPDVSECPHCGIWFHKWNAEPALAESLVADDFQPEAIPLAAQDSVSFYGRAAALVFVAIWGFRLAWMDYSDAELMGSFMHNIVILIHEAGHVFFIPLGEFMTILGGSLFQVALPLGLGAVFLWRQRDAFGAAICLWWAGASMVDVSPYIWDSLYPQITLIGGHTGEDGPHDWIYLLGRMGALQHAHGWGTAVHHLGVLMMIAGVLWGGRWLWRWRAANRPGSQ